jgi:hypothetical protein
MLGVLGERGEHPTASWPARLAGGIRGYGRLSRGSQRGVVAVASYAIPCG